MGSDYFAPEVYELVCANLDAFIAIGGNTIDTAYIYYGGKSEQADRHVDGGTKNRESINVWTKGGHPSNGVPQVNKRRSTTS